MPEAALQAERLRLFSFAGAEASARYVAILRAFDRAREAHELVLGAEQVAGWFEDETPPDALLTALDQLASWGVLERSQDAGRVRTLAEYRRRRSRYQLTESGLRAWQAVRDVLDADPRPTELRRLTFASLVDTLTALAAAVAVDDADAVNRHLHGLDRELAELAERSSRFSVGLASSLRAAEAEPEVFLVFKDRLLTHVEAFSAALQAHLPALAAGVRAVQTAGVARMLTLATAAEDATALGDADSRRAHWARAWSGVEAWFQRAPDGLCRAEHLDRSATAGIRELLSLLRRVIDARRTGVSRATQLESLAGWLARASDTDARALWQAALQVQPAAWMRTFLEDPGAVEPGTPWGEAPAEPISQSLRRHGRTASPGRVPVARDAGLAAAGLRRRAEEDRAARRRLADSVLEAVAQARPLSPDELTVVLRLLSRALATGAAQRARGGAGDGLVITLTPAPGVVSVLTATTGQLQVPGARITLQGAPA